MEKVSKEANKLQSKFIKLERDRGKPVIIPDESKLMKVCFYEPFSAPHFFEAPPKKKFGFTLVPPEVRKNIVTFARIDVRLKNITENLVIKTEIKELSIRLNSKQIKFVAHASKENFGRVVNKQKDIRISLGANIEHPIFSTDISDLPIIQIVDFKFRLTDIYENEYFYTMEIISDLKTDGKMCFTGRPQLVNLKSLDS